MSDYIPPAGNVITLDFKGELYIPPLGNVVALDFSTQTGPVGETQYLFPTAIASQSIGSPSLINSREYVSPVGVNLSEYGKPALRNNTIIVGARGWQSSAVGRPPSVISYFKDIYPPSIDSNLYGRPLVYNLTQYRTMRGFDASEYGKPYLMGGVKYLSPRGYDTSSFGKISLVNTTANQEAKPKGIDSLAIPAPNVSPRMLYPSGFYNNGVYTNGKYETIKFGTPDVRDPAIKPIGELHTSYGVPTVWFHTRPLSPNGILSYQSGYPRVADPTQFVQPPSLLTSAIFGDTAIRNLSFRVNVPAIFDGGFSDYTTLTNSNRYYIPKGIDSLAVGAVSIANKTPSIFVDGIANYDVSVPAIGHAIRFVYPTGFDRLLLGKPTVIKAPELLVNGHEDSRFTNPTVWYKNRVIDLNARGINSFKAGELTAWYRYRYLSPNGWVSSRHSLSELTHGVRTVEPQGFRRDVLGISWVSQGTRLISVKGIYEPKQSNHMVGGTQTVEPAGYIATLWGTRIIPESQSVAPIGFTGVFGDTLIDLGTKYIAPVGYISVGQQPADRWGDIVVYNKLQYIVQEFDINSGLVPPKWDGWTAIENRNRVIGAVSFIAQKFGYSQIDNNAAPLLPTGIEPPPITIGMISHGVRTVVAEAIEAPLLSSWGVVYNAGRVLAPQGRIHSDYGEHSIINTRRYYRNWGMIDSLEMGQTVIGHAIRTIDIEPRYSIAPPQINLPTVDLYTRYVTFRGYETAKYGEPSLSIHFNIIGPSWRHRDDFGYGAVRNDTPELLAGGHDSQEFGRASIRTQWRHVQAQGDTATLFGSAEIADTKREITIRGWLDSSVSQKPIVIKMGTNPYVTQKIWHANERNPNADGYGYFEEAFGRPWLNQNVLYHRGHNSQKFGEAFVHSNNLLIEIGISTVNIPASSATRVENKSRELSLAGIDNEIKVSDKLMVTPFYIKPPSFNHPRDRWTFNSSDKFGRTVVTNQHRTIYPRGHSSSNVGVGVRAVLYKRYIEPPTIRGFAMGFPEIPFTPKTINLNNYGFHNNVYGNTVVERPPYTGPQTIQLRGINNLGISTPRVELLHRELLAIGSNHLRLGASKGGDTPYMWQGLRVGEFVPMKIGAGDTSLFGKTVIGLRVRNIELEGFVAFRSEYEPVRFKDRMKVTRSGGDNYNDTQAIHTTSWQSEVIGAAEIKLGQHFIRPDGNSDQFRKGAF